MNSTAAALLAVTVAFAVLDWWAVLDESRRSVELVAKPMTLAALIGVALTLDPVDSTVRLWFVVALCFCLAGDVFLLFEEKLFVYGLGAFLLGHVGYIVGFAVSGNAEIVGVVLGAALVVGLIATLGRTIIEAVRANEPELTVPVSVYMAVISLMVVSAVATKNTWAIAGALLFYASDASIAWNKFIEEQPNGRLIIMVTYHLGQIGLVVSLVVH
jgi:uncharacterized membrane protein YhhN